MADTNPTEPSQPSIGVPDPAQPTPGTPDPIQPVPGSADATHSDPSAPNADPANGNLYDMLTSTFHDVIAAARQLTPALLFGILGAVLIALLAVIEILRGSVLSPELLLLLGLVLAGAGFLHFFTRLDKKDNQ